MRPWPRRAEAFVALVALSALVTSAACVQKDPPGVGVQKVAADIVFGVEPPTPDTPPADLSPTAPAEEPVTFVPPASSSRPVTIQPPVFPDRTFRPPSPRLPRPTPVSPSRGICPPAALNAFPAQEAGLNVTALPTEGQYRWKRQGKATSASLPGIQIPIGGFEQRLVRNVHKVSDTEYTFETVQPELGSKVTVLSTFKVKTAAMTRTIEPPVERIPVTPPNAVPVEPPTLPTRRVGDPERGIVLSRIQRVDANGNSQTINFNPGVLYLPLDVEPGESYESVGIDPRTGQVLQHQAKVMARQRVDACGEIVDGWLVEATQTFSGSGTGTRTYKYIVAPQLGGIIISENIAATTAQSSIDVTISLGQLKPNPLPVDQQK